jgi:hypothetical protein
MYISIRDFPFVSGPAVGGTVNSVRHVRRRANSHELWHLRRGADLLASLTGSPGYEREVGRDLEPDEFPLDWGAAR